MAANDPALSRLLAAWNGLSTADRSHLAELAEKSSQPASLTTAAIRQRLVDRPFH